MIYSIGDSHANNTFKNIDQVTRTCVGSLTLKRVSHQDDNTLANKLLEISPCLNDTIIFCFGEIDIRIFVKINLDNNPQYSLSALLENWVKHYLAKIYSLSSQRFNTLVMSVVPPCYLNTPQKAFPGAASDNPGTSNIERALYTKETNRLLKQECNILGIGYLDIYSQYKDENGMLPFELSDTDIMGHPNGIHIGNTAKVKELLQQLGLIHV
jgi:hypothetical protein